MYVKAKLYTGFYIGRDEKLLINYFNPSVPNQLGNQINQVKILLGLGRWSGNSILSFIEDTSLPFPFFHKVNQKIMQKCDIETRTKSWIRRVDVNVKAYFAALGIFSVLNIIYVCIVS